MHNNYLEFSNKTCFLDYSADAIKEILLHDDDSWLCHGSTYQHYLCIQVNLVDNENFTEYYMQRFKHKF